MKKALKITLIVVLILVILIAGLIFCIFYGNPVSYLLAKRGAEKYVKENYADEGYHVVSVLYNAKFNDYSVSAMVHDSKDKHFIIDVDLLGNVLYDSYGNVNNGYNTWSRLNEEYSRSTYDAFDDTELDFFIHFGDIKYGDDMSRFEVDKEYDIQELGKELGQLTVYIKEDNVTFERAAELLLAVRESFDKSGATFNSINFVLQQDPLNVENYDEIHISDFKYVDITKNELEERIEKAHDELTAYYAEIDKEKGIE